MALSLLLWWLWCNIITFRSNWSSDDHHLTNILTSISQSRLTPRSLSFWTWAALNFEAVTCDDTVWSSHLRCSSSYPKEFNFVLLALLRQVEQRNNSWENIIWLFILTEPLILHKRSSMRCPASALQTSSKRVLNPVFLFSIVQHIFRFEQASVSPSPNCNLRLDVKFPKIFPG